MERATISRQQQTQRAFLGAALMDPARAREYIIKLVPGMFDEGVSRAVFSAVQQLTMAGEPVDVITVINRASAGRPADEIRPGVVAMAETCPSVSNIGSYAAQILEDYRYSLLQSDLMKCMAIHHHRPAYPNESKELVCCSACPETYLCQSHQG